MSTIENELLELLKLGKIETFNKHRREYPHQTLDLRNVNLAGVDLHFLGLNLAGANLMGANFSGAQLGGAVFANAILILANFVDSDLTGADFRFSDVTGAKFDRARLRRTDFSFTSGLRRADFDLAAKETAAVIAETIAFADW